jgi:hypothetical protein
MNHFDFFRKFQEPIAVIPQSAPIGSRFVSNTIKAVTADYSPLNSPTTIEFSPQTGLFQPGAELFQSAI